VHNLASFLWGITAGSLNGGEVDFFANLIKLTSRTWPRIGGGAVFKSRTLLLVAASCLLEMASPSSGIGLALIVEFS